LEFAKQMLDSRHSFTAVLAFDDLTALGVVRGLTEAGLKVPEDCSVVGFDDVLPAIVSTPGITTIHQPLREMGLLAAQWAVQGLDAREVGKRNPARMHKALPELVVRKSTASLVSAKNRWRSKEQA
jgi:LacI family transcriptional regulator